MTYEEIFEKSKKLILANDASGIEGHLAVQVDITGVSCLLSVILRPIQDLSVYVVVFSMISYQSCWGKR